MQDKANEINKLNLFHGVVPLNIKIDNENKNEDNNIEDDGHTATRKKQSINNNNAENNDENKKIIFQDAITKCVDKKEDTNEKIKLCYKNKKEFIQILDNI